MPMDEAKDGNCVHVIYEEEFFIGKIVDTPVNGKVRVRCLEHPFGLPHPHNLEKGSHAVYYHEIFHAKCEPFQVQVNRTWQWTYKL